MNLWSENQNSMSSLQKRGGSVVDKTSYGLNILSLFLLIFRKQFESIKELEAQKAITLVQKTIPNLATVSSLEEIAHYLERLSHQDFSRIVESLIVSLKNHPVNME